MPFIIPLNPLSPAYGSLAGGEEQKEEPCGCWSVAQQTSVVQVRLPERVLRLSRRPVPQHAESTSTLPVTLNYNYWSSSFHKVVKRLSSFCQFGNFLKSVSQIQNIEMGEDSTKRSEWMW